MANVTLKMTQNFAKQAIFVVICKINVYYPFCVPFPTRSLVLRSLPTEPQFAFTKLHTKGKGKGQEEMCKL